jgi:hypothetical protein
LKKIFTKYLGLLLFAGALIIGLNTYKNYGISWDEGSQRNLGRITYNYLFHGDDSLKHYDNKVYGVGFELPLMIIEKVFNLQDTRDVFLMRHLVTHIFFLLGALAFFLLIDYIYHNKLLAMLGFLLLVVNPLIYGHSFFNTKDIPFLSMFIICFLLFAIAFKKNTLTWYILLGVGCAVLTNMRIMGVLLTGCIWIFFALDSFVLKDNKAEKKKTLRYLLYFTITTCLVLYVTWPYLYPNPVQYFVNSFKCMARYPWEGEVLFWGKEYKSTAMPLNYGISWFCISNPIIYLLLGLTGIIFFAFKFIKNPKPFIFDKELRIQSLFIFCFAEPLLTVLILHSVLYDAWRQLYFIYPPFILAGLYALSYLFKTKAKIPIVALLFAGIGYTGYYMVSNFPHEHIYFNEFVKKDPEYLRNNFELDYWGTSYKQAIDYILKTDTSQTIYLDTECNVPGIQNLWLEKPGDRKRIRITYDNTKANYFASFYRNHREDYPFQNKEVYNIKVLNSSIMTVFKLR